MPASARSIRIATRQSIAQALRRASPTATPNIRIVSLADRLLGRDGRMVAAIETIGRGEIALERQCRSGSIWSESTGRCVPSSTLSYGDGRKGYSAAGLAGERGVASPARLGPLMICARGLCC